jgi:hypothetical protein
MKNSLSDAAQENLDRDGSPTGFLGDHRYLGIDMLRQRVRSVGGGLPFRVGHFKGFIQQANMAGRDTLATEEAIAAPGAAGGLLYQTKGGTATLCGYSEFTSPSSPPKKYRTRTVTGTMSICWYNDNGCTLKSMTDGLLPGGATKQYDVSTCVQSTVSDGHIYETWTPTYTVTCPYTTGGANYSFWTYNMYNFGTQVSLCSNSFLADLTSAGLLSCSKAATSETVTGLEICKPYPYRMWATGQLFQNLSNEDTEDNAIARANASLSWSSCTPSVPADCSAYKPLRGAGSFSLSYRSSQYAVDESGLTIGQDYHAKVTLQRRVYGTSDAFVDYALVEFDFTATGSATYHDVANDSGMETAAVSIELS